VKRNIPTQGLLSQTQLRIKISLYQGGLYESPSDRIHLFRFDVEFL